MKNITLSSLLLAFLLTSCSSKTTETKTTETVAVSDSAKTHACPMHPEITGKKGDKCSECKMDLTEIASAASDSTKMK
jgi:nitrous oxide reductase accessory protein NosL